MRVTKAIFVLTTTFAGLFATGEELWKNLLDDPADWPVVNTYKDSVRLEFGVPVEGAKKALRVTGLREKDAKDKLEYDSRVQKHIEKLTKDYEEKCKALNPVLTKNEMQGVVLLMERMQLDEIDLQTIRRFLDSLKVAKDGKGAGHAA